MTVVISVEKSVLGKNDRAAAVNRENFIAHGLTVLNLVSSPGSGKTALLERTLSDMAGQLRFAVIVGDLQTDNDARRLSGKGAPVVQITTGTVCHLEAEMVRRAADQLDLAALDVLVVENVGNLVCPAGYDLGEGTRVAVLSTTEGEDKPLKYPKIFKSADVILLNKIDIAEAVGFDREAALENLRRISPEARVFEVSARTGAGMEGWYDFLSGRVNVQQAGSPAR